MTLIVSHPAIARCPAALWQTKRAARTLPRSASERMRLRKSPSLPRVGCCEPLHIDGVASSLAAPSNGTTFTRLESNRIQRLPLRPARSEQATHLQKRGLRGRLPLKPAPRATRRSLHKESQTPNESQPPNGSQHPISGVDSGESQAKMAQTASRPAWPGASRPIFRKGSAQHVLVQELGLAEWVTPIVAERLSANAGKAKTSGVFLPPLEPGRSSSIIAHAP